jgi:hypothetical protein
METILTILGIPLCILVGTTVIIMINMSSALIKLIDQLRFYFYIKTEVENQKRGYPYDQVKAH